MGYYGGQLLIAVGTDANNHNYVIAYAIVKVENKENWKWFLSLLDADVGIYRQGGLNFMSDMQKEQLFDVNVQGPQPIGIGLGTFDPTPAGVRPPPITGQNPNARLNEQQMLTSFMPTPRFTPRGPRLTM